MPIARFQLPDGRVAKFEVPDGTSPEQAQQMISAAIKPSRIPDALDNPNMATEGMSGMDKFLAGMGKAGYDLARGVGQIANVIPQEQIDATKKQDAPLMATGAGMAGNVVGNMIPAVATAAIPGANTMTGAALGGAVMGGMQPVASDESRLRNAGLGAAGGAIGQGAANLVGRLVRPVQSSLDPVTAGLAAKAEQYGIPLNAAQKTGSRPLKIIDSVLDNLPLTADAQAAAKSGQAKAFNKAVLGQIGESADVATPEVLNAARTRIGNQFNQLSDRNAVKLGDEFLDALAQVEAGTNAFTKPGVKDAVEKGLELASQGQLSGRTYQNVRSTLGKQANDAFASGNSELGQALKSIKTALDDAADASVSQADKAAWTEARRQWQALKVVEKAASPTSADAVAGNVSAAKLAQALKSVDKKGLTYGTSNQELGDLARIGQALLKNQIPDSGTAQRTFYQNLLTNPITALWQGGVGGISKPVQMLINSKAGQAYLGQGPIDPKTLANALRARQLSGAAGMAIPLANAQEQ